jgi:type VI protein secretion system component Hcp
MAIESDVYVRWDLDHGNRVAESKFDGDSTDWSHWYWSEARTCGFTIQHENQGADAGKKKGGRKKPYEVTMTKKVDYASPYLFLMCCLAKAKPPLPMDFPPQELDEVRVEVCRPYPDGELSKMAFVVIIYEKVKIKKYQISMNGPEANESLTLEFESFKYGFRPTSPFTGKPTEGGPSMKDRVVDGRDNGLQWGYSDPGAGSSATSQSGDSDDTAEDDQGAAAESGGARAAEQAGILAASAAAVGAGRGTGSLHILTSEHDATTRSTFPGLWDDNGFDLLPD